MTEAVTTCESLPANPERQKYASIYEAQKAGRYADHYGHCNHGRRMIGDLLTAKSVLDVGCGHNELVKELRKHGINATGADFACPGADVIADAMDLPFDDDEFEFVTAFDMLEHLRPEQIEDAICEMSRVSVRFIFSIAFRDSVCRAPDTDETLHPTVWSPEQWEAELAAHADDVKRSGAIFTGRWAKPTTEHITTKTEIA